MKDVNGFGLCRAEGIWEILSRYCRNKQKLIEFTTTQQYLTPNLIPTTPTHLHSTPPPPLTPNQPVKFVYAIRVWKQIHFHVDALSLLLGSTSIKTTLIIITLLHYLSTHLHFLSPICAACLHILFPFLSFIYGLRRALFAHWNCCTVRPIRILRHEPRMHWKKSSLQTSLLLTWARHSFRHPRQLHGIIIPLYFLFPDQLPFQQFVLSLPLPPLFPSPSTPIYQSAFQTFTKTTERQASTHSLHAFT